MTTRPHPHLSAVGPTVRALPHAAGQHERRSPALAVVEPLPLRNMATKRTQRWVMAGAGVVFVVSALLSSPDPEPDPVVRPTWTEAAGYSHQAPLPPLSIEVVGR